MKSDFKKVTLEGLEISNFKKFSSFYIHLNDGVNYVSGRNGSGKSSILEAIAMVLSNGQLPTTAFKDPHFTSSVICKVDGKTYQHSTNAKLDTTGKVIGTTGERRIEGVQVGVNEFAKQAGWSTDQSFLFELVSARNMATAQKMAFELAGIKSFKDYFFALEDVAQPIVEAFNATNGDGEHTVALLKKKSNDARKDAEKCKVQAEALAEQVQMVAEKVVVPADVLAKKAELIAQRNQLTAQLQGVQSSDADRKAQAMKVADKANDIRKMAQAKRIEAQKVLSEANRKEVENAQAENQKRQADVSKAMQIRDQKSKYVEQVRASINRCTSEISRSQMKVDGLKRTQSDLRNRWSQLQTVGVCPLTGQSCEVAASKVAEDRQAEISKVVEYGKKVAADIAEMDANISNLNAELEKFNEDMASAQAGLDAVVIPTVEYVKPLVHSIEDVQAAKALMGEADKLDAQANAVSVPAFQPSSEVAEIGTQLQAIAVELQSIEAKEHEVRESNAKIDAAIDFNKSINAKIDALNADRLKAEENEAVFASYVQIFSGYVRTYMDQSTDAVNQLFECAHSYLPGLRIKLFAEQMSSSFGKQCFVPQLVQQDGSVSEALSDGENQLFSIALITEVYQKVTGVRMPILVDRSEAIDPERLDRALAGNQAVVAKRVDCELYFS